MKYRVRAFRLLVMTAVIVVDDSVQADAPPGRYTVTTDTVTDTETGLTWARTAGAPVAHAGAVSYCASLATAGGGWRLPEIKELLSLMDDERRVYPRLDPIAFPNDPLPYSYWSATIRADPFITEYWG